MCVTGCAPRNTRQWDNRQGSATSMTTAITITGLLDWASLLHNRRTYFEMIIRFGCFSFCRFFPLPLERPPCSSLLTAKKKKMNDFVFVSSSWCRPKKCDSVYARSIYSKSCYISVQSIRIYTTKGIRIRKCAPRWMMCLDSKLDTGYKYRIHETDEKKKKTK